MVSLGCQNIVTDYFGLPTGSISGSFIPRTIAVLQLDVCCAGCVILWRYYRTGHIWSGLVSTDLCAGW